MEHSLARARRADSRDALLMSRLALALLLVPAIAAADTFSTDIKSQTEEKAGVTAELMVGGRRTIDACWKKPATATVKIAIVAGKVTTVAVTGASDPSTTACISKAFSGIVVSSTEDDIAILELAARKIDAPAGRPIKDPEARVALGPADAGKTGLQAAQIDKVLKVRAAAFRACYQKELDKNVKLAGKAVVRFEIAANGTVKTATVRSSTLASATVGTCITGTVRRLKFPASAGPTIVTYPFVFSRDVP